MEPDLSDFYYHALDYGTYVGLAYGISAGILALLSWAILFKRRHLKTTLNALKDQ